MITVAFAARCAALRHRGLSVELMHGVQDTGDEALLVELEQLSDADLVEMTRLSEERRVAAVDLARAAGETGYVVWSKQSTGEVVRVAALGEPVHRQMKDLGRWLLPIPMPRMWQDEGDQG